MGRVKDLLPDERDPVDDLLRVEPAITVHAVLAAAYGSNNPTAAQFARGVTHASCDGGHTALCGRVRAGNLCDDPEPAPPTCPRCAASGAPAEPKRYRWCERGSRNEERCGQCRRQHDWIDNATDLCQRCYGGPRAEWEL